MKQIKVAVFGGNAEFCARLREGAEREDMQICAVTSDGNRAKELIEAERPDAVVLDLVLSGIDGFGVLDFLKERLPDCKAVVITDLADEVIIASAIEHGASYFFVKPVLPQGVVERLKELTVGVRARRTRSVDEKISNIFAAIGISASINGSKYLRLGIKLVMEQPNRIERVTIDLYPRIGEDYHTSGVNVEHSMRHALKTAWSRGRAEEIRSIFGPRTYISTVCPTTSEFIALVADKLMLEDFTE